MDAFIEMIETFLDVTGSGRALSINDFLPDSVDQYTIILIAALVIIIGVLQCFLGFKSFKVWCSFIGLIIGAVIGTIFVYSLSLYESEYAELISIFFIVCLALVGAFVAYRAHLAGIFLYAFAALFILCYLPLSTAFDPDIIALIIGICAGVAAGVVAVIVQRIAIITATSLSGGIGIAAGLMLLLAENEIFLALILPIIVALALAVGGFFVQLATTKKKPEPVQPIPITVVPVQGAAFPANMPAGTPSAPPTEVVTETVPDTIAEPAQNPASPPDAQPPADE